MQTTVERAPGINGLRSVTDLGKLVYGLSNEGLRMSGVKETPLVLDFTKISDGRRFGPGESPLGIQTRIIGVAGHNVALLESTVTSTLNFIDAHEELKRRPDDLTDDQVDMLATEAFAQARAVAITSRHAPEHFE